MIHIWKVTDDFKLDLNIEELLKYPILANIYRSDKDVDKFNAKEYFKY